MDGKFKAAQFLKDIGLMFQDPEMLIRTQETKVVEATNVVPFKSLKRCDDIPDMAVPEYAVWIALKNLVATYGIEKVEEGMSDLKKIRG